MTETLTATRSAFVAPVERVEIRESRNGTGEFTLTGHAAVFNRWSEELSSFFGTFREQIAPGAFADVLQRKPDVRLLFNHDGIALARTKSGTLELSEDDDGLRVWARLAPTSMAADLRMAMQRGDVDQMSFAFAIAEDEWREDHEGEVVERTITRVSELFDVSVVTFPAYPDTDATMRELRDAARAGKIHIRTVIPYRETPKADVDSPWDGPGEVARADVEDLRAMCAWYDSNNADVKASYKLPHHRADASHPVVWRGVRAAMQRLTQTDIPESDMEGCHAHLARHYAQFDKEPPEMGDMMRARDLELPEEVFETREALAEAVAQAEIDPADTRALDPAQAEIDPAAVESALEVEPAETDPAADEESQTDFVAELKERTRSRRNEAHESYLRLLKEQGLK